MTKTQLNTLLNVTQDLTDALNSILTTLDSELAKTTDQTKIDQTYDTLASNVDDLSKLQSKLAMILMQLRQTRLGLPATSK